MSKEQKVLSSRIGKKNNLDGKKYVRDEESVQKVIKAFEDKTITGEQAH